MGLHLEPKLGTQIQQLPLCFMNYYDCPRITGIGFYGRFDRLGENLGVSAEGAKRGYSRRIISRFASVLEKRVHDGFERQMNGSTSEQPFVGALRIASSVPYIGIGSGGQCPSSRACFDVV